MTNQQLRERLISKWNGFRYVSSEDLKFTESLIAIICEQRQTLERYASRPAGSHNKEDARVTLTATNARLKKMGVL